MKHLAQFTFGPNQNAFLFARKIRAGAVDACAKFKIQPL